MKLPKLKVIRFKSIKANLIFSFTSLLLLSSVLLGSLSLLFANRTLREEAEKSVTALAIEAAKLEASRLETRKATLETIASIKEIEEMNWDKQEAILFKMLEDTDFNLLGILQMDGTVQYTNGRITTLSEDDPLRSALHGDNNAINFSNSTGEIVLVQAVPIEVNGTIVGAVVGLTDGIALTETVLDMGYGKEGYGYILNENGTVIAHPNTDFVYNQKNSIEDAKSNSSEVEVAKVLEKIISSEQGIENYEYNNEVLYAGYATIEGTDWTFVITCTEAEVLAALPALQKIIITTVVIIIVLGIIISYIIGSFIAKPIILSSKNMARLAELDISKDVDPKYLKKQNEIGIMTNALQNLTNSLRDIIREINNSSQQVAASSEELTATSQQTSTTAQEVAKTVEEIALAANEQAKHTEDGTQKAMYLGNTIMKVEEYISNVNIITDKVTNVVKDGLVEIANLNDITEENMQFVKTIYDTIVRANESSNKIDEASHLIETIAEQTNLLSLNASIEAARAGEAGKGFAVVAAEIGKLAEQSKQSTHVISQIVNELQSNTQDAVDTMNKAAKIASEQAQSVANSKEKYELIAESMRETIKAIEQLTLSGKEMNDRRQEILDVLESLSAIAEENAASTEEASASMEEQTASVEEVASASNSLAELAENLQMLVAKFKV